MKRLLAAGSGDIYQLCRVFRGAERGRQHNPEFTMVEWYRLGFSLEDLMREVAALMLALLGRGACPSNAELSRSGATPCGFRSARAEDGDLAARRAGLGFDARQRAGRESSRDELLDLIVGAQVGPALGASALTFVHRYPASQAALARLDAGDPQLALRFELYHRGVELANGYHELTNARSSAPIRCRSADASRRAACRPNRWIGTCWPHSTPGCRIAPASHWVSIACSCSR